jgi:anti-anti-sigma regulatory factor
VHLPYAASLDERDDLDAPARRVLTVVGEIERGDSYRFEVELERLLAAGGGTVDLTGATYLPSAALAPLAGVLQRAVRGQVPVVVRAERHTIADRVLQAAGIPHDSPDPA